MDNEAHLSLVESCGYRLRGHFVLPESEWWNDFYTPMESLVKDYHTKYAGDSEAEGIFQALEREIEIYRKYSDFYGYVFYIMQRR